MCGSVHAAAAAAAACKQVLLAVLLCGTENKALLRDRILAWDLALAIVAYS